MRLNHRWSAILATWATLQVLTFLQNALATPPSFNYQQNKVEIRDVAKSEVAYEREIDLVSVTNVDNTREENENDKRQTAKKREEEEKEEQRKRKRGGRRKEELYNCQISEEEIHQNEHRGDRAKKTRNTKKENSRIFRKELKKADATFVRRRRRGVSNSDVNPGTKEESFAIFDGKEGSKRFSFAGKGSRTQQLKSYEKDLKVERPSTQEGDRYGSERKFQSRLALSDQKNDATSSVSFGRYEDHEELHKHRQRNFAREEEKEKMKEEEEEVAVRKSTKKGDIERVDRSTKQVQVQSGSGDSSSFTRTNEHRNSATFGFGGTSTGERSSVSKFRAPRDFTRSARKVSEKKYPKKVVEGEIPVAAVSPIFPFFLASSRNNESKEEGEEVERDVVTSKSKGNDPEITKIPFRENNKSGTTPMKGKRFSLEKKEFFQRGRDAAEGRRGRRRRRGEDEGERKIRVDYWKDESKQKKVRGDQEERTTTERYEIVEKTSFHVDRTLCDNDTTCAPVEEEAFTAHRPSSFTKVEAATTARGDPTVETTIDWGLRVSLGAPKDGSNSTESSVDSNVTIHLRANVTLQELSRTPDTEFISTAAKYIAEEKRTQLGSWSEWRNLGFNQDIEEVASRKGAESIKKTEEYKGLLFSEVAGESPYDVINLAMNQETSASIDRQENAARFAVSNNPEVTSLIDQRMESSPVESHKSHENIPPSGKFEAPVSLDVPHQEIPEEYVQRDEKKSSVKGNSSMENEFKIPFASLESTAKQLYLHVSETKEEEEEEEEAEETVTKSTKKMWGLDAAEGRRESKASTGSIKLSPSSATEVVVPPLEKHSTEYPISESPVLESSIGIRETRLKYETNVPQEKSHSSVDIESVWRTTAFVNHTEDVGHFSLQSTETGASEMYEEISPSKKNGYALLEKSNNNFSSDLKRLESERFTGIEERKDFSYTSSRAIRLSSRNLEATSVSIDRAKKTEAKSAKSSAKDLAEGLVVDGLADSREEQQQLLQQNKRSRKSKRSRFISDAESSRTYRINATFSYDGASRRHGDESTDMLSQTHPLQETKINDLYHGIMNASAETHDDSKMQYDLAGTSTVLPQEILKKDSTNAQAKGKWTNATTINFHNPSNLTTRTMDKLTSAEGQVELFPSDRALNVSSPDISATVAATTASFRQKTSIGGNFFSTNRYEENSQNDEEESSMKEIALDEKSKKKTINSEESSSSFDISSTRQTTSSSSSQESTTAGNQWPVKHSAVVEGDLVLGGLMMVHEREDTVTCGPIMPQGGIQALEAMLYTLDVLNAGNIIPGVKIGAHILDDCDKDTYGLEMAVDFIKGSISNIDGAEYHCNKTTVRKVISGVVGAASSVTSIQVANLLRLFRIPQVSFFSTSPELSNKQRFEYFTRTIPSDHYQVKAMVDIVLTMRWSYVSIIYEESNYGIKAFEELEELLTKYEICIAVKEKLVKDSGVAEETAYDNIVLKLLTKPRAKGCIIFGSDQEVAGVMRAVRRCNATGAFSWIGSDGWSARGLVSNGNEAEVEGTLSVQPQANPVKGFQEYFLNLTVENNRRNPWFVEFWEDHFQCRYPNSSGTPYNSKYTKTCTTKERLTKQNTAFEDQLQFVSDAVMAFAYAFRDMHNDLCGGNAGLCDAMRPTKGTELLKYLRKVHFEGLSGDEFRFDKNGDGPARYNIIHFKQTEPGVYKWIRVGKYLEGELRLNMSEIQFKLGHSQPPESVCSLPCELGQAKKYVEGESCCWHCFNCSQYQIRHPLDETQCINCRQGTVPDETHSTCRDIPEEFLRLESGWAIGAMSFSATGILVTLFVCGVFLKHNDTPVVRASGRELSYVLLTGILLCYLVTFALVLRPTDLVCSIQRFGAGFCFTVVYAALLTKTNRISRIFNAGKHSAKRPSFISPRSQLIICSGLVSVQILINGVWIVIDPAKAMHHYPTKEDNLLVCNSYIDASYMIAFAYPIMLIVVCTVYAVLTRKIPEAFNESKHIGFTMYTTCVIWLAFVPLYFGTGNHVALRITSMSVTISLSASVTIACLFTPKLYIILIRPERNVRQSMMPARYSTTKSSAVTGTNASSMMAPVTLTAVTCDQNKAVKKHIITTIDCSTQSEHYELELKEQKNGKPPPTLVTRATQTQLNNNEKDIQDPSHVEKESKESNEKCSIKQTNDSKIGNGPINKNDLSL